MKLFDSELKIMEILWREGDISAKRIAEIAKEQIGWSKTTTYTNIKRCIDKDAVKRYPEQFICHPLVTKEETQEYETNELINKMYGGAADQLVAFPSMAASSEASDNTPYDYPVKPGGDEWKSFTEKAQKVEICQIPEEKLQSMTTEALLETVLNYPLLSTFITFNSTDEAYNVIYQDFNGLRVLLDRDDVTEVFIEKYSGIDVNKTAQVSSSDSESFLLPSTLEFLNISIFFIKS